MSISSSPPVPAPATVRRTTTVDYEGKGKLLPWLAALAVVPLVIALVELAVARGGIEDDLTERSQAALAAAGFDAVSVDFDGRDATLSGVPAGAEAEVAGIVKGLTGVRVAEVDAAAGSGGAGAAGGGPVSLAVSGEGITVTGTVPDGAARAQLLEAVRAKAGGRTVVDRLTVQAGATAPDAGAVAALAGALGTAGGDRTVSLDGTTVTLTGTAGSEAEKQAAGAAAAAAVPAATVDNRLTVTAPAGPGVPAPAEIQAQLNALLKATPVTFEPASDRMTAAGAATVGKAAALLRQYPQVRVEVGGHTDNQGNPATSQPLSQRRADAVTRELIRLGVAADRVQAKGYGESKPVASNNTAAGQAANRRVEITVITGGQS